MPRRARFAPGGQIYHVLNRANGRDLLFDSPASYRDFLRLVSECAETDGMRILAYCVMPNHWHMVLWPRKDGDLFRFVHRLSVRHARRRHARNGTGGRGHIYQARYKSFVVKSDEHLLVVLRYVEQNPVRARLVARPREWRWSSAAHRPDPPGGHAEPPVVRLGPSPVMRPEPAIVRLEPSPVPLPDDWAEQSDREPDEAELERLRASLAANVPFGDAAWATDVARQLGLSLEARPRGRPRKAEGSQRAPYRARRRGKPRSVADSSG